MMDIQKVDCINKILCMHDNYDKDLYDILLDSLCFVEYVHEIECVLNKYTWLRSEDLSYETRVIHFLEHIDTATLQDIVEHIEDTKWNAGYDSY